MRYFGIGLSKTGTSSLAKAFQMLGYTSQHYLNKPMYTHMIKTTPGYDWDFVNDMPISHRYVELEKTFNDSKFIYTIRNIDNWLLSCENHWKKTKPNTKNNNWNDYKIEIYGRLDFDKKTFTEVYYNHRNAIMHHFHHKQDKLLLLDITGGDKWETLCPFIDCDIPNIPFPFENKTVDFI